MGKGIQGLRLGNTLRLAGRGASISYIQDGHLDGFKALFQTVTLNAPEVPRALGEPIGDFTKPANFDTNKVNAALMGY